MDSINGCWIVGELVGGAYGSAHQFTATVRAAESQFRRGTLTAEGALEGADIGVARGRWEVAVATLTVGAEFQ